MTVSGTRPAAEADRRAGDQVIVDRTAEQRARREMQRRERQLEEVQRIAGLGSWEYDLEADRVAWSAETLRILGLEPGAWLDFPGYLRLVDPEDRDGVRESVARAMATGGSYARDHRIVRPDGERRWVHGRGEVEADENGRPVRLVGTTLDITEIKEAEAKARRLGEETAARLYETEHLARQAAEEASRAKSQFVATVSHELRTPLSAIIGYQELLSEEIPGPLNAEQLRYLGRIRASATHLRGLIDQILGLSRIEAGREEVLREEVDLAEVVRGAALLMEQEAVDRGLDLSVRAPESPIPVTTDSAKVRQILINLLSNAVKFTAAGSITVSTHAEEERVLVAVRDTGPGIAVVDRERIFDVFTQVDQSTTRSTGGSGLGLAVGRRLARLLGGDVEVESEPGEGSCFTLWIPREPAGET